MNYPNNIYRILRAMTVLHIHIGLAKTGTSTLQARMMSGMQGYLGKSKVDNMISSLRIIIKNECDV